MILLDVPGTSAETVLLYGHCDKQPEMVGWGDGLGPWKPVRRGDRLYGRGAQDDGYAVFCALTAIEAVQRAGRAPRALRGPDRGERGERQPRPARLHGASSPPASASPIS